MKQIAILKNFETCLPSSSAKSAYLDVYLERDENGNTSAECMYPGTMNPAYAQYSTNEMMGWFDHADHHNLWEDAMPNDLWNDETPDTIPHCKFSNLQAGELFILLSAAKRKNRSGAVQMKISNSSSRYLNGGIHSCNQTQSQTLVVRVQLTKVCYTRDQE